MAKYKVLECCAVYIVRADLSRIRNRCSDRVFFKVMLAEIINVYLSLTLQLVLHFAVIVNT